MTALLTITPALFTVSTRAFSDKTVIDRQCINALVGELVPSLIRDEVIVRPFAQTSDADLRYRTGSTKEQVSVGDVRLCPGMKAEVLERLFIGPGTPKELGSKTWGLINGIDSTVSIFVPPIATFWFVFTSQDRPLESSAQRTYLEASSLPENGDPDFGFH